MAVLIIGIVVFLGCHLIPLTGLKASLITVLGDGPYKTLFSIASLLGLALMIWGLKQSWDDPASDEQLYVPAPWARHVTMLLVLLGFISLAISLHKGRLRVWLRNPMSIGFALWSFGHLLSNGSRAAVLFFGTFFVIAVLDIAINTVRGTVPAIVPKPRHDPISIVAGVVLYLIFLFGFHPHVLHINVV